MCCYRVKRSLSLIFIPYYCLMKEQWVVIDDLLLNTNILQHAFKTRSTTCFSAEALNKSDTRYTNIVDHKTRKNNLLTNFLVKFAWKKALYCEKPQCFSDISRTWLRQVSRSHFSVSPPIPGDLQAKDKNVKKSCLKTNFIEFCK